MVYFNCAFYLFLAKIIEIKDNMSTKDRIILCASEAGGTAILLFLGCMGCVNTLSAGGVVPHEQLSFTFGLAVMVAIQVNIFFFLFSINI